MLFDTRENIMEDSYETERISVKYISESNVVVIAFKAEEVLSEEYRTSTMLAVDLLGQHKNSILIIDRSLNAKVEEADIKWARKTLFNTLVKSGCKHCFIVDPEHRIAHNAYPHRDLELRMRTTLVGSIDEALAKIGHKLEVSSEVLSMTKEEALTYMNLPADCDEERLENRFWQLSKNMRIENSDESQQKLVDLSAAYDIASGNAMKRKEVMEAREQEPKILGKTKDEWKTWFSYTWYWFVIGVVAIAICFSLIYTGFFRPDYDSAVIAVGHFQLEPSPMNTFLTETMGFSNPYINSTDVSFYNTQEQISNFQSESIATALFSANPNVVISDSQIIDYYYSNMVDLSDFYAECEQKLPAEVLDNLELVYCSEEEWYATISRYQESLGMEYEEPDHELSEEEILIGIQINNEDYIRELGFSCLWPDTEPNLVFGIYTGSEDMERSEYMLMGFLATLQAYL
jgi:hypothetical protein